MEKENLIAVILCGGQSKRMGQDKGLIEDDGTQWARQLFQKLENLSIPAYISANAMQMPAYLRLFPENKIIQDKVWDFINGPLHGILTAHQQFPEKHILYLPCDMPRLDQDFFQLLLNTFSENYAAYKFIISQSGEQLQPLCGIYNRQGLEHLITSYYEGELSDRSMISLFEENPEVYKLFIQDEMLSQFKNFNAPDDLDP